MPLRKQRRARWVSAWILAFIYLGMGVAYTRPDEFVRNPERAARTAPNSVIVFIENLTRFPAWGSVFLLSGFALAGALIASRYNNDRYIPWALLTGGVVFVMYGFAGWCTAIINPGTYITNAVLATGLAAISLTLMYSYAQRPSVMSPPPELKEDEH